MKNLFKAFTMALFVMGVVLTSCDKGDDKVTVEGEALFEVEADGMTMTFNNLSEFNVAVTYAWDFGDGETSTEESPVHTYAVKGEYTVVLTVTDEQGGTHLAQTKVVADKATRIKLDDGSFDDWAAVTEPEFLMSAGGEGAGIVTQAKVDYDGENIYMYIEFTGTVEYGYWFDLFFDVDNDTLTGHRGWIWPTLGADWLIEGQYSLGTDPAEYGNYYFTGGDDQSAWSFADDMPFSTGYMTLGHIANLGDKGAVEFSVKRSKITDLGNQVQVALFLSDPETWGDVGYAPNMAGDDGIAKGFLIDMR